MIAMASQITSLAIVYTTVCSRRRSKKHQSSASLAFERGIHRWPVNSPHKGPVTRKMFPFDDVIMVIRENFSRRHLHVIYFPSNSLCYHFIPQSDVAEFTVSSCMKYIKYHSVNYLFSLKKHIGIGNIFRSLVADIHWVPIVRHVVNQCHLPGRMRMFLQWDNAGLTEKSQLQRYEVRQQTLG